MKTFTSFFAALVILITVSVASAEMQTAGVLGPVRVVSAKLVNPTNFPNLGLISYDIVVTVESSNVCMVPAMFVQTESNEGQYTLSGVYAQGGCSGEFDPVTTEVSIGQYTVLSSAPLNVSVNGVAAVVQNQ